MADNKNGTQGTGSGTATETGRKRKKITKVDAVGRAMAALGEDASRTDLQGYVRQKFGLKIGLDHISNCKGELAKRAAKATTPAGIQAASKAATAPAASRKPTGAASRPAQPAPVAQHRSAGGNGSSRASILLEDVLTAKLLIDRVGAGPLKTLIDGLAK